MTASSVRWSGPRGRGRDAARATRPFRHPFRSAGTEIGRLGRLAREGRSAATPLILAGAWIAVLVPLVALVVALSYLAASLAAR
jgi:hypothetical protein